MKKQAFTIVEVLTTVLIISILTAVAVPHYTKVRRKTKVKEAQAMVELALQAMKMASAEGMSIGVVCDNKAACEAMLGIKFPASSFWDMRMTRTTTGGGTTNTGGAGLGSSSGPGWGGVPSTSWSHRDCVSAVAFVDEEWKVESCNSGQISCVDNVTSTNYCND